MRSPVAAEKYPQWPNLAAMMFRRAAEWPSRPMLRSFTSDGTWKTTSWDEFARLAAAAARGLRQAGVSAGDRVLIVSENRPEYPIAETALLAIGALPIPTYATNTVEDFAYILRDSGARVAIVSSAAIARRLCAAGTLVLVVTLDDELSAGQILSWAELTSTAALPAQDIAAEAEAISAGSLACIIYTSGTGGAPKGVMLSHRAVLSNCYGAFALVQPLHLSHELYLSALPLSHSYEHTVGQFFLLSLGTEIAYGRGIEHLAADMMTVRPTIMAMVPRILEVIRARILAQVERQSPWRRELFRRAVALGYQRTDGRLLSPIAWVAERALHRLVLQKVTARFGGRLRVALSGGARLDPDVGRFFQALGVSLMQGYGQTEAGPVISATLPGAVNLDTVGPPLAGVEVRIAADGEILVRGDLLMDGYWNRPDETREVIRNGWLHTGDVGSFDAAGNLCITDRKRDIIVLSGGDNVSPAKVEAVLAASPAIVQAVVFGDGQSGLSALIVAADGFGEKEVSNAVGEANRRLNTPERVRQHRLVKPFTLEDGLMTATQKIRRQHVLKTYASLVSELRAAR